MQLPDTSERSLHVDVGQQVPSPIGLVTERGRTTNPPTLRGLLSLALCHSLANQPSFELGEHAAHLSDGSSHWIVGIVLQDLAAIAERKYVTSAVPDLGENAFLLR